MIRRDDPAATRVGRGHRARVTLVALAAVALIAAPLSAQDRGDRRRGPQDRERMEQRLREQMARVVQERLDLTDEESERLSEITLEFQQERRSLARSERATRRGVEELLREGGDDQEAARDLLDRMVELRARESRLFSEEQEALLEVLTPRQVLQLQAFREHIGRRIRALRGRGERGDTLPRWFGLP